MSVITLRNAASLHMAQLDASWHQCNNFTQAQCNDFLESQYCPSHLGDVIDRQNDKACVWVCVCRCFGCMPVCGYMLASVCVCVFVFL